MSSQHSDSTVRRHYVESWNRMMVDIWKERIVLLGAFDKGGLYNSVVAMPITADERVTEVTLQHSFFEYGLFVDRGTGRETAKGNPGDIGRPKVRVAKPWYNRKYWSSVNRLKEFFADSLGEEFVGVIAGLME